MNPPSIAEIEQTIATMLHSGPAEVNPLKELLDAGTPIIAPGCHNAMASFMVAEEWRRRTEAGLPCAYNAAYSTGWGISGMTRRLPDRSFHSIDPYFWIVEGIVKAARPLGTIIDIEAGIQGGPIHIPQTVVRAHQTGCSMMHLEDQDPATKDCGHRGGRVCVPPEIFEAKIRAALLTLSALDSNALFMARTDSIGAANGGFHDAVERGKRYLSVETRLNGIERRPDVLWAEFDTPDPEVINNWVHTMKQFDPDAVLGINHSPNKDWPDWYRTNMPGTEPPTHQDFVDMGFGVIWMTIISSRAAMEALQSLMSDVADNGAQALYDLQDRQRGGPVGQPQQLIGAEEWATFEKYISPQRAADYASTFKGDEIEGTEEKAAAI